MVHGSCSYLLRVGFQFSLNRGDHYVCVISIENEEGEHRMVPMELQARDLQRVIRCVKF